jgi:hypothetical protein
VVGITIGSREEEPGKLKTYNKRRNNNLYLGRTYLSADSTYVKFVGYNLSVSDSHHVCNC